MSGPVSADNRKPGKRGVAQSEQSGREGSEPSEPATTHFRSSEIERIRIFSRIARTVAGDFDLTDLVQTVTDAATQLSGGKFGAFFYNETDDRGEIYSLYALSGVPRSAFANFEMPRNTAVFAPTFNGTGIVRSNDIRKDPRYGRRAPHFGLPKGHLPVVSYLAVPIISRTGIVHGGLFIAHDEPGRFDEEAEEVVQAIAAHAAIAINNVALLKEARRDAEEQRVAHELSAKLAAIVEHSDDAIISKSLQGIITSWNAGAERLFGYSTEEAVGKPITMLIPDDRLHEEDMIIGGVREGIRTDHFETLRRHKDGRLINVSLTVSPIRSKHGLIIGASKIARDISERIEAQERQALLSREMHHRIKNLFALTTGLIALSSRSATTVKEFADSLTARIVALDRAHSLTMTERAEGAPGTTSLLGMLRALLSPYEGHGVVEIGGDDASINGTALTSLALVLHELATNAAKYGALSSPEGHLSVTVSHAAETMDVDWLERGGPSVSIAPTHTGFGSKLEKAALNGLKATIQREWSAEGLHLTISVPVTRLTSL